MIQRLVRPPDENPSGEVKHAGTHATVKGDFKTVREGKRPWNLYNLAED